MEKLFCKTVLKYITGGNLAVEKLAEETAKGMAQESPLQYDTKRDAKGKAYIGGAFRNPLKAFNDQFLAYHSRAIEEIWIVHQKNTGALNYGNILNFLEGRGGKSFQDTVAEYTDMEKRYNLWFSDCKQKPREVAICVFGRGMNFSQAAMSLSMDRGSIKAHCIDGLEAYRRVLKEFKHG